MKSSLSPVLTILVVAALGVSVHAQEPATEKPAAAPAGKKVQNVTPDEVEKLVKADPKIVILDVRTPEEFEEGHLPGAVNQDFLDADFAEKLASLEGQTIIVHCASGNRSGRSLEILTTRAIPKIYHMNGGYKAWVAAGKTVAGKPDKTK